MSPKGSCQKSSKDGLKLGSFGYDLATYFWDGNNQEQAWHKSHEKIELLLFEKIILAS